MKKSMLILIACLMLTGCTNNAPAQPASTGDIIATTTLDTSVTTITTEIITSETTTSVSETTETTTTVSSETTETITSETEETAATTTAPSTAIIDTISDTTAVTAPPNDNILLGYITDNSTIEIVGMKRDGNYLVVHYKLVNKSDEKITFSQCIADKVYQNDIECERATDSGYSDLQSMLTSVSPYDGIIVKTAYLLQDAEADVNIKISEFNNDNIVINIFVDKNNKSTNQVTTPEETTSDIQAEETTPPEEITYILDIIEKKYHTGACEESKNLDPSRVLETTDHVVALANGYQPCKKCIINGG